jgi:hypothetical protein
MITSNKPKQQVKVRSAAVCSLKIRGNNQQAPKGNKKEPIKFGANPINGFKGCGICTKGRIKNFMAQMNTVPVMTIHFEKIFSYILAVSSFKIRKTISISAAKI